MARLRRRWRAVKWVGAALALLIGSAWAVSIPFRWTYYNGYNEFNADGSRVVNSLSLHMMSGFIDCHYTTGSSRFFIPKQDLGWRVNQYPSVLGDRVPAWVRGPGGGYITVPLWMPLLIVVVPTAYLFWRDRRRPPPHCCQSCGYDLTGNASGTCPECGRASTADGEV